MKKIMIWLLLIMLIVIVNKIIEELTGYCHIASVGLAGLYVLEKLTNPTRR